MSSLQIHLNDRFMQVLLAVKSGNAIATVKSGEKVKIVTVRSTAFPPAAPGTSAVEVKSLELSTQENPGSKWIKEELSKSDRPELGYLAVNTVLLA